MTETDYQPAINAAKKGIFVLNLLLLTLIVMTLIVYICVFSKQPPKPEHLIIYYSGYVL